MVSADGKKRYNLADPEDAFRHFRYTTHVTPHLV
jgi:hypothetical protein